MKFHVLQQDSSSLLQFCRLLELSKSHLVFALLQAHASGALALQRLLNGSRCSVRVRVALHHRRRDFQVLQPQRLRELPCAHSQRDQGGVVLLGERVIGRGDHRDGGRHCARLHHLIQRSASSWRSRSLENYHRWSGPDRL